MICKYCNSKMIDDIFPEGVFWCSFCGGIAVWGGDGITSWKKVSNIQSDTTQISEEQAIEMLSFLFKTEDFQKSQKPLRCFIFDSWKEKGYIKQPKIESKPVETDDLDKAYELFKNYDPGRPAEFALIEIIKQLYREIKELKAR